MRKYICHEGHILQRSLRFVTDKMSVFSFSHLQINSNLIGNVGTYFGKME